MQPFYYILKLCCLVEHLLHQEAIHLAEQVLRQAEKRAIGKFLSDQRGQMTVEWALLVAAFGLPMIYLFGILLATLAEHYRMLTLLVTLPFP